MGYVFIIIASVLYGIMPIFPSLLQKTAGWNTISVLFDGLLVGAVFLFVLAKARRVSLKVERAQLPSLLLLGGGAFCLTSLLLNSSYKYMFTGLCTMLHFVYPIVVMLIMMFVFKEKATWKKLICMVACIFGIFLIVSIPKGAADSGNILLGALLATCSGVAYAVFIVANAKSKYASLDSSVSIFYVYLTGAAAVGAYIFITGSLQVDFSGNNWIYALGYPMTGALALLFLSKVIHKVGATKAAIFNMLEPVMSMIVSIIVFGGSSITARTLIGCCLVLAALVFITIERGGKAASGGKGKGD